MVDLREIDWGPAASLFGKQKKNIMTEVKKLSR